MGGYGSGSGGMGGYGSGSGGMGGGMGGGYGMGRCCKKKYVEGASNPDMNGYYVLAERAEWWKVPSYCSSPCVYVKWSDMNMSDMSGSGSGMGGYGSGMGGYGSGSGMGMDKEMNEGDKMMMMMKLQKYCFQPSQDTQAMCAADEDMNGSGQQGSGYGSGQQGSGYGSGQQGSGYGSGQ